MAKTIWVKGSCGCEWEMEIRGYRKEAEREAVELAKEPCPDCAESRRKRTAAACEANAGLPALTGSPKQIAWSETIRAQAISQLQALFQQLEKNSYLNDAKREAAKTLITERINCADAKTWIDERRTAFNLAWLIREMEAMRVLS